MDPTISRCLQGGSGELGLALSYSGERQELSTGGRQDSQRGQLCSQERVSFLPYQNFLGTTGRRQA